MQTIPIKLKYTTDESYDIIIDNGLLTQAGQYIRTLNFNGHAIIISDPKVSALYLKPLQNSLKANGITCQAINCRGGESAKTTKEYIKLTEQLLAQNIERKTLLIALGGGVCGDLCGFLAATLLRSVPFVQIPTSLLAQVDSAVGGKVGINSMHGKNLIGAFYQPQLVLCDTAVLQTLPLRQLKAGYAEILKYALINDADFFNYLEQNAASILNNKHPDHQKNIAHAIETSCRKKAQIIAQDHKEYGKRALLNLGHTFAHALEACRINDSEILHGEAVSIGLELAFRLSVSLKICPENELKRLQNHLQKHKLIHLPKNMKNRITPDMLMQKMKTDKKINNGKLRFIVAEAIGKAYIRENIDPDKITRTIENYLTE